MTVTKRTLKRSQEYLKQAQRLIPGASQTFSKAPSQYVQNVSPVFLQRGQGSHVWDVDGNEYIDYPTSLGPIILGHNDPDVNRAVARQLEDGTIFSMPHPLEVEVSQLLTDVLPSGEMVRFGKNGSDVTSAAVRLARAYTGRDIILCCGYHGWQDWHIGTTTRNRGVPDAVAELTKTFEYNDIISLQNQFHKFPGQVAGVIMEPMGIVEPKLDYLQQVKKLTSDNGALLIFDEVLTGFRLAMGGAQEYFNVQPDLSCFAKAMANGYPISAIVGSRKFMSLFEEIFFSGTFGGETLSLAATKATINKMQSSNVIDHLWRQGRKLQVGYDSLAKDFGLSENTKCIGLAPHTVCTFTDDNGNESLLMRSVVQQELVKRGVLFLVGFNICYALTDEDVEITLDAVAEALKVLSEAKDNDRLEIVLEGPPVQAVFRRA